MSEPSKNIQNRPDKTPPKYPASHPATPKDRLATVTPKK